MKSTVDGGLMLKATQRTEGAILGARPYRKVTAVMVLMVCALSLVLVGQRPASALVLRKDITYKTVGNLNIKLDVRMPSGTGPYPAVMLIHGGKNITGDKCQANLSSLEKQYVSAGFVVYTPNYRLAPPYPANPNLSPKVKCANGTVIDVSPLQGNIYPASQNDLRDALAWIKNHGGTYKTDVSRVSALGTSSGGTQAYMLGSLGEADVAVGFSGPTYFDNTWGTQAELADYFGCSYSACPNTWKAGSPLYQVSAGSSDTDIYNSSNEQVPRSNADRYYQALVNANVFANETIIPGSKHATTYLGYVLPSGKTVLQDSIAFVKTRQ